MKNEQTELAHKLNRVHLLYDRAIQIGRPYRIGRIRNLYTDLRAYTESKYQIVTLTSENYSAIIGRNEKLDSIIAEKLKAVSNKEYELAAGLRDRERRFLQSLLEPIGVGNDTIYFVSKNVIVKLF
jgi:hypothetical protein